jgi:hypothetical protein
VALIGPLVFAAFWFGTCHLLAALGGWKGLARAYPPHGLASGDRLRFQTAQLRRATNYSGCLTIFASPLGMRVTIWPIFVGHPPFEVPWAEIDARLQQTWLTRFVMLTFQRTPEVTMRISGRLAERLVRASGQQLQLQAAG